MPTNETKTIFDIMNAGGIRIPRIQRDYAQGRDDQEGTSVRSRFVPALFNAVFNNSPAGMPLQLDFIYGVRARDKALQLLDGQQRITTLFLLAWYIGCTDVSNWVFDYESRRLASEFVKHLKSTKCTDHLHPVDELKKQHWYLRVFEDDPTVLSSLKMIDAFAENFADIEESCRGDKLTAADMANVRFYVKDITVEAMSDSSFDEIYLKMNARGLPLTDWENIRAIIDKHAKDVNGNEDVKWCNDMSEWEEKLWLLLPIGTNDEKIKKWNIGLERLTRICARVLWGSYSIDIDGLDDKLSLSEARMEFFIKFREYCEFVVAANPFNRCSWCYNRAQNPLWAEDDEELQKKAVTYESERRILDDFLFVENDPSALRQLRFDSLVVSEHVEKRRRRTLLNILDGSQIDGSNFAEAKKARDAFLNADRCQDSITVLEGFSHRQVEEELWKCSLEEMTIKKLERDSLAWNGSIGYLDWGARKEELLISRAAEIKNIVQKDESMSFFCDLLRDLQCYKGDQGSGIPFRVEIPYASLRSWAEHVFYLSRFRDALKVNRTRGDGVSPLPEERPWLRHLREILLKKKEELYCVQSFDDGWTYLFSKSRTNTPRRTIGGAIRLDRNDIEAKNRKRLLGDKNIRYGDSYCQCICSDVYYDVSKDSENAWWKSTAPQKFSKKNNADGVNYIPVEES